MKFCFATYTAVLLKCKKPIYNNTILVSKLISSVCEKHGQELLEDPILVSNYVTGVKNISPRVLVYTLESSAKETEEYFRQCIIPLLDENSLKECVLALIDIVSQDDSIPDNAIVEYVSRTTKKQLKQKNSIKIDSFLAGLFLYTMTYTKNKDGHSDVKSITKEYVASFVNGENGFRLRIEESGVVTLQQGAGLYFENDFDEETSEKARLFCLDHEADLHLLPLCEMASILNPKHKHVNQTIDDFIHQNKKTQRAILISESIRPFELCSMDEIDKCVDAFKKEVNERGYSSHEFLYDGAKYFHRAFDYYADYEIDDIDPFIFTRNHVENLFPHVRGRLYDCLLDFEYTREHFPGDDNPPPFDIMWCLVNWGSCDEKTAVFWVNRFIITTCHFLHGKGYDSKIDYDNPWEYKDIVRQEKLRTMEEMYYYALLLLYLSYGPERKGSDSR